MKTFIKSVLLLIAVTLPATGISAQDLSSALKEEIRTEIESLHRQEQKAFVDGDCEKVISFYKKDVTFFTNGKKITSLDTVRDFCKRVSRPFTKPGDQKPSIDEQTFILSRSAAYTVKIIN